MSEKKIVSFLRLADISTVCAPAEDRFVNLRRQVLRQLRGERLQCPVLLRHTLVRLFQALLGLHERVLGELLLGDISHNRDRSARSSLAAMDAIVTAGRCLVLEARARGIAQALHAPGDLRIRVALPIVTMRCQIVQEVRVRPSRPKQFSRNRIHLPEAVIAEDDIQRSGVRLGQKRKFRSSLLRVRCTPKRGRRGRRANFRSGPKPDSCAAAKDIPASKQDVMRF